VLASRVGMSRWSGPAWGAIGAAAAFIAITCWWLSQDRSIPIYDAGDQLETAFEYHSMLAAGNLLGPLTHKTVYPILGHMVGALAAFVGGVNVASPIIGENLVFVPLLALGCYQIGRLLFGGLAGMLAVVAALGASLLISLFHVFLLDGPLTALVAVSVWLLLASEDFSRPRVAALAGLAVGLGLNMKVQFALYLVVLVLVVVLHGGWRNRRGLVSFVLVAAVVGLPWYIVHINELGEMIELSSSGPGTPPSNIPARLSIANFEWYFWSITNSQLLAPLSVLAIAGTIWTVVTTARDRAGRAARLEFLLGGFGAWLVITFVSIHHDIRYGLPLLAFVSVAATGWIAHIPRVARVAALALLTIGVAANVLALDFGVGHEVSLALSANPPASEQLPDRIQVLSSTSGFLAGAPSRDGDVPGLLAALRRDGVSTVEVGFSQSDGVDFSFEGLNPLARVAGLTFGLTQAPEFANSSAVATLVHQVPTPHSPPACTLLQDHTGIWIVRFDVATGKLAYFCPARNPQYYDSGAIA
jgi:4-amino-4-deoxy-L-arabinose transferase-like glycosyltransferase